jgi:hypothetical protein
MSARRDNGLTFGVSVLMHSCKVGYEKSVNCTLTLFSD